jgi:hypothetical protein
MIRTALLLVLDLLNLVALTCSSHNRLAAENLFVRKPLAFYVERKVKPRRLNDAARIELVVLARPIDWQPLLFIVRPDRLVRWHRQGFRLFWRQQPGIRLPATYGHRHGIARRRQPVCVRFVGPGLPARDVDEQPGAIRADADNTQGYEAEGKERLVAGTSNTPSVPLRFQERQELGCEDQRLIDPRVLRQRCHQRGTR